MARSGYRIFDADTHVIEPAEPIEAYLSAADKARLAALGAQVGRAQGKGIASTSTRTRASRTWTSRAST